MLSSRFLTLAASGLVMVMVMVMALPAQLSAEEPLPNVERLKSSPVLQHLAPNAPKRLSGSPADETVKQMHVPPGFRVELILSEPQLHQPVAFAFDERGRIWVAEAHSYPAKQPLGKGLDEIAIFEDVDGDGQFESRKSFAQGLNLVSGLEVGHGGVWIGAAPELLWIPDRDADDVPDGPPQVLLDGFGYQDTHECLNSFTWGPDGWLYGNQGVFNFARIGKPGSGPEERAELRAGVWRYHPVRHQFEVFASGTSNPWGLDFDEQGQCFMTHCRSYWGRGCTTHVVQGGHYWNQANANHAPFIVPEPPAGFPEFQNFLLASARYDHGAGGAGPRGSDAIYGGHSHVGTLIYLGDNWPAEYRGHLFTHNLHGHQINHQINQPLGSTFNTVHAGKDVFFCSDPRYVAVDLQCGPDGAVYFIDWYDSQHCHNPNTERWDRSNGRLYRMEYAATYAPKKMDLRQKSDADLASLLTHRNAWFPRTARRLLSERSHSRGPLDAPVRAALELQALSSAPTAHRLNAWWTLHECEAISLALADKGLGDPEPYVRAWNVQLLSDNPVLRIAERWSDRLAGMAESDPSPIVRRALASAVQRSSEPTAWRLIEALVNRSEDQSDRIIPLLLWQGLAPRMAARLDAAFALARTTPLKAVKDSVHWYASVLEGDGLEKVIGSLEALDGVELQRRLAGMLLAMNARSAGSIPKGWNEVSQRLFDSSDVNVRRPAELIAAAFGHARQFPRLRKVLADAQSPDDERQHAFSVLRRGSDVDSLPVFLKLLDESKFRSSVLRWLPRFDSPQIASDLIQRYPTLTAEEQSLALGVMTARASSAMELLNAVDQGRFKREALTSFHVRQLLELKHAEIERRVAASWGRIGSSPADALKIIQRLERTFQEAPLWAYSDSAGRQHFLKLCASCHRVGEEGVRLGPELTGAGRNGIRYYLENIVEPNSVIGADFQMTTVERRDGEVVGGIVAGESAASLTLRTATGDLVIPKSEIARRALSEKSLMPESLLASLNDREQLELLKFLIGH